MTIQDMLDSGIEFQSDVTVKSFDYVSDECTIFQPLVNATEYYDLNILYIYQNGDEIVIELENEE